MPHIMTISIGNRGGLIPKLECTEVADAAKSPCRSPYPESCSIVACFEWDSAYAVEGYVGADIELSKFSIHVLEASEDAFEWEMADPASPVSWKPRYSDPGRCVRCRHAEHDGFACLNMQSDNDCACPSSPDSERSTD